MDYTNLKSPDKTKILKIKSERDFDRFTKKYGVIDKKNDIVGIKWLVVAMDFAGIEIIPYLEERRNFIPRRVLKNFYKDESKINTLALSWYYSWDIPSGCVWNWNAIKKIELIKD